MWLQVGRRNLAGMQEAMLDKATLNHVAGVRERPSGTVEQDAAEPPANLAISQTVTGQASHLPVLPTWKMGLVVTVSALCGGIAVVLWNRRLLTRMREVAPVAHDDLQGRLWEDDV